MHNKTFHSEKRDLRAGFTLIELLVVISIIGMIASVVLANVSSAKVKARIVVANDAAIQYKTALQSFYFEKGSLPLDTPVCIGIGNPDGTCGWNGSAVLESSTFMEQLKPYLSTINALNFGLVDMANPNGAFLYSGYQYSCTATVDTSCTIYWALPGENQNCGAGTSVYYLKGTMCRITLP